LPISQIIFAIGIEIEIDPCPVWHLATPIGRSTTPLRLCARLSGWEWRGLVGKEDTFSDEFLLTRPVAVEWRGAVERAHRDKVRFPMVWSVNSRKKLAITLGTGKFALTDRFSTEDGRSGELGFNLATDDCGGLFPDPGDGPVRGKRSVTGEMNLGPGSGS